MIKWEVCGILPVIKLRLITCKREIKAMTDIEIAQSVKPRHILEIAKEAGVDEKYIELHGSDKAKLDLSLLRDNADKPD